MADVPKSDEQLPVGPPPKVQFSIRSLLIIMVLVSVLAAIGARLYNSMDGVPDGAFVVLAIAAPMGVMIIFSFIETVGRLITQYREDREARRSKEEQDDV